MNMGSHGIVRFALSAFAGLSFWQCERTVVFAPKVPDSAHFRDFHLGTYSTKYDEDKEIEGTIFQTTLSFDLKKESGGWLWHRKLDTLIARGYHKLSMPHELERKVDLDFHMDASMIPIRINGYDSLKAVLGRIQQKEEFKKVLLQSSDTAHYRAEWRDWWRMNNALPKGVKLEAKKALPVTELNKSLETVKVDSARFDGPRPRLKRTCLDFTLYYHRTDSLALLVEQFFFSGTQNRKYRKYSWKPTVVQGFLQYSVERSTGLPCFQSKTEMADITLEYKPEKAEAPIHLYRYEEDIYE